MKPDQPGTSSGVPPTEVSPHPATCENCGSVRPTPFCPQCGQNDRNYARGLATVVWEFGREAFEMDSRFFQTLKLLLFKPGSLTNEFSRNRRARYMSPIRLYLFTSFLFVLVLSLAMPDSWSEDAMLMGGDSDELPAIVVVPTGDTPESPSAEGGVTDDETDATPPVDQEATDDDADEIPRVAEAVAGRNVDISLDASVSEAQIEALKAALGPTQRRRLDDLLGRPDDDVFKRAALLIASLMPNDVQTGSASIDRVPPDFVTKPDSGRVPPSEAAEPTVSGPAGQEDPDRPILPVRMFLTSTIDLLHDPEVFVQRAVGNMPIAMFFLLPFLALALGFCYVRKRRFFVEHLVFGMHNQTFTFLCLAAAMVTPTGPVGNWFLVFFIVMPQVYYLIALRRYYRDGWIRTILKGSIVWWLYMMILLPGFLFVLFLTA
ncbi:MAG: DUF3667 domain-containing protein [Gemmatimonadetes bacterium]|nr:DUF3667 domain-containing protein [Gemmatimonadota bacterium]MYB97128.1 DUF3667 domain-containing protein [Gemmatimonadota bacterium]MYI47116.1 DUF3667 domain-containing protein [Gemmatimonadota bacterium]